MRRLPAVIAFLVVAAVCPPASAGYGSAQLLFNFQDARIRESSGIAPYSRSDDIWFTHNDSGDWARFFAVGSDGKTRARYEVAGPVAVDWEDMARGPGADGGPALFFADFGDNDEVRPTVTVYEVPEPVVPTEPSPVPLPAPPSRVHHLLYEDRPHNAETLLVDPSDGSLAVVTKDGNGVSGLYEAASLGTGLPQLLHRTMTLDLIRVASGTTASHLLTTGGAISPDGSRVVVRTYAEAFEWTIPFGHLPSAFAQTPVRVSLPTTVQGEAICYSRAGTDLVTTSEGTGAPVHRLPGAGT
ncbi:MAG TPA: hypothetical protein VNE62_04670 [Actinomycetota bacterium]|nr:hypothetical protein [Actinomycetota bacterium]